LPSLIVLILDRGNDNWLIKYEKTPEVDKQVQAEQGVRLVYTFWYVCVYYGLCVYYGIVCCDNVLHILLFIFEVLF